jgi:predicted dehydrogenase
MKRVLLWSSLMLLLVFILPQCASTSSPDGKQYAIELKTPKRAPGQTDVIELRTEPIDTVRVAFIGLGNRGVGAVHRYSFIPTAKITVLCDVNPDYVQRSVDYLERKGIQVAATYTGEEDWRKVCERDDVDLVYVCTQWDLHHPIAVYAMQQGKHVAVELPLGRTIDELWEIVNTAELTRRHCMMLENTNYDFFELTTLNMVQQGLFGEIVHAEGSYIHDLRSLNFSDTYYWNQWRLKHNAEEVGSLYPMHGLGPIAHAMNIHRGDKMNLLVHMASDQFGMTEYAKNKFGEDSPQALAEYKNGDMNTSLIKTEKGKTIMIQHDVTSPRPYSRHHVLSGTKGFAQKYPNRGLAFEPDAHNFMSRANTDSILKKYEHPIISEIGELARKVGGHGGMDFMMDYRLIYCLNHGLPLDQDVYDGAEWSALIPLSRLSIEHGSRPVVFPDFTRGAWNKVNTVTYYKN